ncbi:MAG: Fe-S cluster assembly protein SufD [Planctomycetes bacterium]|nr:Fe-S cluster assembly protein SufD [Planctomycetota bacterium]
MANVPASVVQGERSGYLEHFERFERAVGGNGQAWFLRTRKSAIARFAELGFPTTKHEEWRYTSVARIAKTAFERVEAGSAPVTPDDIAAFTLPEMGGVELVFVNGHFSPHLSTLRTLPNGATVGSLARVTQTEVKLSQPYLGREASFDDHAFVALNTALWEDGALIHIPAGTVVAEPIHLLFIAATGGTPVVAHPRILILADATSEVTIIETYAGVDDGLCFTNAVTEIVVGESATVDHYQIEREGDGAFHVATLQVHQHRASNFSSHSMALGGELIRNDVNAWLDGEGCECTLNGLYMVRGTQHVDNHLRVDHAQPHCNSREFYKGILDGKGRGVFSGRIIVREGAQKTDAKQTNRNLILSRDAQVESKPQLEILADDVKCTHGATVGQVDENALYYLRSRGITAEVARDLLIHAFARESLAQVRPEPLRVLLDELVRGRLPHGELVGEAV